MGIHLERFVACRRLVLKIVAKLECRYEWNCQMKRAGTRTTGSLINTPFLTIGVTLSSWKKCGMRAGIYVGYEEYSRRGQLCQHRHPRFRGSWPNAFRPAPKVVSFNSMDPFALYIHRRIGQLGEFW